MARPRSIPAALERRSVGAGGAAVEVLGTRIAYDDEGAGPAVVCLHALGHGARDYAALRELLAPRFRVLALDFPDHGNSGPDREPVSAGRYAAFTRGFLDVLAIDSAILIGNSIGGAAAIEVAASDRRVRALVVMNPGGLFERSALAGAVTAGMARFFEAGAAGARWFPRAFAAYYGLVLSERAARDQRRRIVDSGSEIAPLLAEGWRSFTEPSSDVRVLAARVECPVLVAWATKDRFNPLWANRAGVAAFPHARLERFRAGHNPSLEQPERFAHVFDAFVREAVAA